MFQIGAINRVYRNNPLEEMTLRHQARFENSDGACDGVQSVTAEITEWPTGHFDIRKTKQTGTETL